MAATLHTQKPHAELSREVFLVQDVETLTEEERVFYMVLRQNTGLNGNGLKKHKWTIWKDYFCRCRCCPTSTQELINEIQRNFNRILQLTANGPEARIRLIRLITRMALSYNPGTGLSLEMLYRATREIIINITSPENGDQPPFININPELAPEKLGEEETTQETSENIDRLMNTIEPYIDELYLFSKTESENPDPEDGDLQTILSRPAQYAWLFLAENNSLVIKALHREIERFELLISCARSGSAKYKLQIEQSRKKIEFLTKFIASTAPKTKRKKDTLPEETVGAIARDKKAIPTWIIEEEPADANPFLAAGSADSARFYPAGSAPIAVALPVDDPASDSDDDFIDAKEFFDDDDFVDAREDFESQSTSEETLALLPAEARGEKADPEPAAAPAAAAAPSPTAPAPAAMDIDDIPVVEMTEQARLQEKKMALLLLLSGTLVDERLQHPDRQTVAVQSLFNLLCTNHNAPVEFIDIKQGKNEEIKVTITYKKPVSGKIELPIKGLNETKFLVSKEITITIHPASHTITFEDGQVVADTNTLKFGKLCFSQISLIEKKEIGTVFDLQLKMYWRAAGWCSIERILKAAKMDGITMTPEGLAEMFSQNIQLVD